MVPLPSMKEHLKACPMRLVLCPARCGEMVLIPHIPVHQKTTCGHRVVPCPLGCGSRVRQVLHVATMRSSYQCMRHTSSSSPPMCLRRVCHLLRSPRPPQVDRKAHLQTVCGLRVVKCPYGCLIRENPATNAGVASDNVNTFGVAGSGSGSGGQGGGEAAGEAPDLSAAQALLAAGANMTMFPAITVVPWTEEDEREAKLRQMAAMEVRDYMGAGTPLSSHELPLVLTVFPPTPHRRAAPPKRARAGRTWSTRKRRRIRRRATTAR